MSSGFVSEADLAEARKKRQEEWEKVRNPEEPLERPEEPYDPRSLYEKLQEQKLKKDLDYEEAHKLKNLIRGLDDDEVTFLNSVDRTKMKAERQQQIEENKELNDFRQRVAILHEKSIENKLQNEISISKAKNIQGNNRPSQKDILSGVILRKRKLDTTTSSTDDIKKINLSAENEVQNTLSTESNCDSHDINEGVLKCVGILPGIGRYLESSDSENSSDSDEEIEAPTVFDLIGRKIAKQSANCGTE